jgi:hypothetical protein
MRGRLRRERADPGAKNSWESAPPDGRIIMALIRKIA